MRILISLATLLIGALLPAFASAADADVYQWSATIDNVIARETKAPPRAFLWVPGHCERVRAVVIAIQNMEEEQVFQNASFRKNCADLGFAIVWITPPMGSNNFRFDQGEDKTLQSLLAKLADESGYGEIRTAPLVPFGHSASASWCWDVAAWNPQRTLAVVSLSGQWPYFGNDFWGDRSVDGVPGLTTKGEFEIGGSLEQGWYAGLKKDFYAKHPNAAFTQVVEPGDGHFAASDAKIELINLFLSKAVQYRLPAELPAEDAPAALKPIDAGKTGWRYDVWHLNKPPEAAAAPVGQYKGKFDKSFWAFDEEMARAIEKFQGGERNKLNTLIGYRQKGGLVPPKPDHVMVHLKFEPIDDTLKFKLTGGFFDTVPPATTKDNSPAGWQRMLGQYKADAPQGSPIDHPSGQDDRMTVQVICGPVVQLSNDTFALRFNRTGFDNPKRAGAPCFILTYPGDDKYRRMVQQAEMRVPLKNDKGADQTITFPKIEDQKAGTPSVRLGATSSAKVPVFYYVREGPAIIDGDTLHFTEIPPRAKFPLKVTVVAWQWGRVTEPKLKSALPVEQAFDLQK